MKARNVFTPVTIRRRSAAQGCADAQHSPCKAASSRRVNGARSHEQLAAERARTQKHGCEAAGTRAAASQVKSSFSALGRAHTRASPLPIAQQQPRQQQQEEEEEEAAAAEADEPCGVRAMPMPVSSVWMCIEHAQFL